MSTATAAAPAATPTSIPLPVGRLVGVGAVVFFANAALLVLQLVAGRLLAPFVGSSLETWTSIIGVFLAGIALGNALGGKLADRYPTPRTLAALLAVGAVAALWMLFFPMLLSSTGVYKAIPLGVRIPVLATLLCLPAGFVLSLLTPLAIKLGLPDVAHTGRVAGLIFALSTLGCLIGNYFTGFYLIPHFTINALVLVSAGVLLGLAATTFLMQKQEERATPPALPPNGDGSSTTTEPPSTNPNAFPDIRRAYLIVFLASFCGMTLELTASRVLAQDLGVSLFTWTGIIGVMLAGTALGNFTGGQLADRPNRALAWLAGAATWFLAVVAGLVVAYSLDLPVWYLFGVEASSEKPAAPFEALYQRLQIILGLSVVLGAVAGYFVVRLLKRLPAQSSLGPRFFLAATLILAGGATVFLFVMRAFITMGSMAFTTWDPITQVIGWTFSMFFLPMFMLGLVSPQVIRLSVPDVAHAGRVAGRVYAWSTTGAIVGTFAAGYVLLSTLGMYRTILGASLVLVLSSLLVVNIWKDSREAARGDNRPGVNPVAGAGFLLYLFSIVLGGITGGYILTRRTDREPDVVATVESNYYTIKVSRDRYRETAFKLTLDHLVHSSVDIYDPTYLYYPHEHIQMEFLRAARAEATEPKTLVIGGGGYTFPRYAKVILPETVMDVVEIDPKVTQVAYEHLGLKPEFGINHFHMDGRQYVAERAKPGSYDLIIQDAVNDLSVPSHLMTKEYNDAVKAALKLNGIYLLTIIDSIERGKLWKAAMATLGKTFPPENIALLTPEAIPEAGTGEGARWDRDRRVLVIYASDRPLDIAAFQKTLDSRPMWLDATRLAAAAVGQVELPGSGSAIAFRSLVAAFPPPIYTIIVPRERLQPYLDREPGVILTDQFCPIDNLMAEVFRYRYRDTR